MSSKNTTKSSIINYELKVASIQGLEGVTIGGLAKDLKISKSGLFRHFGFKEVLQLEILKASEKLFFDKVIYPALCAKTGLIKLKLFFDNWLNLIQSDDDQSGCFFTALGLELDEKPGSARNFLVSSYRKTFIILLQVIKEVKLEKGLLKSIDSRIFINEIWGIIIT